METIKLSKKSTVNNLTPADIIEYVRNAGTVKVIPGAIKCEDQHKFRYDVVDAEYNAPLITFKQANSDDVLTIDKRKIRMSFYGPTNNEMIIYVGGEYGCWRICANYDEAEEFDFRPSGKEPLKPHEVRACLRRAASLESGINKELGFNEDSKLKIYVRFHSEVIKEDNDSNDSEPPSCVYDYKFKMMVGSNDEKAVPYTDDISLDLGTYGRWFESMRLVRELIFGLMRNLLPVAPCN